MNDRKSEELQQLAKKYTPGGVHSSFRYTTPFPIRLARASGSKIYDVDGKEYTDYFLTHGAVLLGHAYPKIVERVREAVEAGLSSGLESELTVNTAKQLVELIPDARMAQFTVTGSEAVQLAIMAARTYTGRKGIIKMEGHYHGRYDYVLASAVSTPLKAVGPAKSPIPFVESHGLVDENITANTFIAPYNNIEILQKVIQKHKRKVAAVILEPVYYNAGTVLPKPDYLKSVRELTEKNDMLLIFDEIISGFRFAVGGAQQYYGVKADYATYGKAIANGYPISALVGNEEKMEVLNPENKKKVVTGGTFNAHYVSISALSASLEELRDGHVQRHLIKLAEKLQREFTGVKERAQVKARIQAFGGAWGLYFTDKEVTNYREAQATDGGTGTKFMKLREVLMADGIYLHPRHKYHHGLSYSHTAEDIDYLLTKMESSLKSI